MRLKKRKITVVRFGRLEHQLWRGRPPAERYVEGVDWAWGHLKPTSTAGRALLATAALQPDEATWWSFSQSPLDGSYDNFGPRL